MGDVPNVLIVCADHLRHDMLGCNGNGVIATPNVDRLAAQGVTFLNAFTPDPICVPARAAIATGNYPHRATGTKNNSGRIRDDQPRLADHFARAGYRTYAVGKLHYLPYASPGQPRLLHGFQHAELCEEGRIHRQYDPHGEQHGLEEYHDYLYEVGWGGFERAHGIGNNDVRPAVSPLPAEHYVDAWVAARSIENLRAHLDERPGEPFLMFTSFPKPHPPYDPPEPYHRRYDPRDVPPPVGDALHLKGRAPTLMRLRRSQLSRARYMAQVTFQDEMIGRLLDFLETNGLSDNTIVVYTSDHGDLLGDFGCFYKANMLNGSVRVPLVVRAPGRIPAGIRRRQCAGLQDILPTLAALTGVPLSDPVHGMDLTPVLEHDAPGREVFVSQCLDPPWQQYMLCDGRRKYIYSEANGVEEFYDLEHDPHELRNLVETGEVSGAERAQWRERLVEWCRDHDDRKMLPDGRLAKTPCDVEATTTFQPGHMGWRYF